MSLADDDKTPEAIEREIEHTRARVEGTIDAIQDRLSPGQMVDQAIRYVREGGGGDFVNNFGRSIRDNPIPVALMGVGLVWLIASGSRSRGRYEEYEGHTAHPDYGAGDDLYDEAGIDDLAAEAREIGNRVGDTARSAMDRTREGAAEIGDSVRGMAERGQHAASQAAGAVSGAVSQAAGAVSGAVSQAAGAVSDAASRAGGAVSDFAGSASHTATSAGRRVMEAGSKVGDTAVWATNATGRLLREQPLLVGAVGLAIGAAIASLLPTTRREAELLGPTRDRLKEQATQRLQEGAEKMVDVGSSAAEAVISKAREEFSGEEQPEKKEGQEHHAQGEDEGEPQRRTGTTGGPAGGPGMQAGSVMPS